MKGDVMKFLAFDIETANPAPEDRESGDFKIGITCAATHCEDATVVWCPELEFGMKRYPDRMTPTEVQRLAEYLVGMKDEGYTIASVNGSGFDLRVIAEEARDQLVWENMQDLTLEHFDPAFQMVCARGFPVGLEAMARGFLLEGKTEGMHGKKAVEMWMSEDIADQAKVLEYVKQDAVTTWEICNKIAATNSIKWVSRKGKHLMEAGRPLLVEQALRLKVPDTSWMDRPWKRSDFIGWTYDQDDK
jgi:hypothetical protein